MWWLSSSLYCTFMRKDKKTQWQLVAVPVETVESVCLICRNKLSWLSLLYLKTVSNSLLFFNAFFVVWVELISTLQPWISACECESWNHVKCVGVCVCYRHMWNVLLQLVQQIVELGRKKCVDLLMMFFSYLNRCWSLSLLKYDHNHLMVSVFWWKYEVWLGLKFSRNFKSWKWDWVHGNLTLSL